MSLRLLNGISFWGSLVWLPVHESSRLDWIRHSHHQVLVTVSCLWALHPWRHPAFLTQGALIGTILTRKVTASDASLWGWGATHEGRAVSEVWDSHLQAMQIIFLEFLSVLLALKHFIPFLREHYILVWMDNTETSYLKCTGNVLTPIQNVWHSGFGLWVVQPDPCQTSQ